MVVWNKLYNEQLTDNINPEAERGFDLPRGFAQTHFAAEFQSPLYARRTDIDDELRPHLPVSAPIACKQRNGASGSGPTSCHKVLIYKDIVTDHSGGSDQQSSYRKKIHVFLDTDGIHSISFLTVRIFVSRRKRSSVIMRPMSKQFLSWSRSAWLAMIVFLFLASATARLHAQGYAKIVGTVTDASGAVIPSATVTATQTQTGVATAVKSGADGAYVFPALLPSNYSISVSAKGFEGYTQTGIVLEADQSDPK